MLHFWVCFPPRPLQGKKDLLQLYHISLQLLIITHHFSNFFLFLKPDENAFNEILSYLEIEQPQINEKTYFKPPIVWRQISTSNYSFLIISLHFPCSVLQLASK